MVLREAGQYLKKQVLIRNNGFVLLCINFIIIASFITGISFPGVLSIIFNENTDNVLQMIKFIGIMYLTFAAMKLYKIFKIVNKNNSNYEKGLVGEKQVEYELSLLQGENKNFYVIHDFQLDEGEKGNIDHIIICEKGVFIIETKNINYIGHNAIHLKKQAKGEAAKLQKIISEKFKIGWVNAILVIINKDIIRYVGYDKYCKVCSSGEIQNNLQSNNNRAFLENPRDIFIYLVQLQQKKSSDF